MNLTLAQISQMCGGNLSKNSNPDFIIYNVVIDSRQITDNNLFVAIIGENHDAHDFVAASMNKFNIGAIVNKDNKLKLDLPNLIYVEDTTKAIGLFAHAYRKLFNIPIVGITGSNGKTTVKEMLKLICDYQFGSEHVLATSGNLNNHLGMPLTLLKLNQKHKVAIIEMGMNHAGELDYLSKTAKPTLAVVNNVMLAHAGFFSDLKDIAMAKAEIYHGLDIGAVACINNLDPYCYIFEQEIPDGVARFYYGKDNCYIVDSPGSYVTKIRTPNGDVLFKLQILGEHNQRNALTATSLAINLGCELSNISNGLSEYKGFKGRLELKTAFNGALIIDDCYNANPESVKAAVLAIKDLPKPHWFIFANLLELGKFAQESHKEIGQFVSRNNIDVFLTVGELALIANNEFPATKLHFENNTDIVKYCRENLPPNATILVKGSRSMHLDDIIDNLLK